MPETTTPATLSTGQIQANAASEQLWDVIVIGTGIGGGLAGRRLAEQGLRVLFVEKGPAGHPAEQQTLRGDIEDYNARQMRSYWPTRIEVRLNGGPVDRFFGPIGSGVGGTSVFYAAALERPERHDIESTPGLDHPVGGWPIGYDDFMPYIFQAEDLLSVRGEADPLSDLPGPALQAPPLTKAEALLFDDLRASGLHPYRSHEALRRLPGCDGCIGRKCPRSCKMDGRSAGVEPAVATGKARLLANCAVEEMVETGGRITHVRARADNLEVTLRASIIVLAAGALHSPRLLLGSTGTHEAGCANSSGWVGRGLMLHLSEMFALWPRRGHPSVGATRTLSFRDLYTHQGTRLGLVQSMGIAAEGGLIASYLKGSIASTRLRHIPGLSQLATLAGWIGGRLLGGATVFVGVLEDLAYHENRVRLHPEDPDVPVIDYHISNELRGRRDLFRRLVRQRFGRRRVMLLGFRPSLNFGHPSGTLRFGNDPSTSVLDASCKAHDLDNLYVADASFFPSSLGANPSLTIAANALRVADIVAARLLTMQRKAG